MTEGEISFNPTNYKREGVGGADSEDPEGWHLRGHHADRAEYHLAHGAGDRERPTVAYGALSFDVQPGENEYNVVLPAGPAPRRLMRITRLASDPVGNEGWAHRNSSAPAAAVLALSHEVDT